MCVFVVRINALNPDIFLYVVVLVVDGISGIFHLGIGMRDLLYFYLLNYCLYVLPQIWDFGWSMWTVATLFLYLYRHFPSQIP